MPTYQYSNPKGQEVGYVDNNIFYCVRNANKNHIFKYKKYFNGVYINNAVAIQKKCLDDLIEKGVQYIEMIIIGIEAHSFKRYIETKKIKENGQLMRFDNGTPHGWGWQYVFSYELGSKVLQETLE